MEMKEQMIKLTGADTYIPQTSSDAFRVVDGSVLVNIVPWNGQHPGKRVHLCEVPAGTTIPAFVYQDEMGVAWRFCLSTVDHATLLRIPGANTSVLRRKFSAYAKIADYAQEGFDNCLINRYQRDAIIGDVMLYKGEKEREHAGRRNFGLIRNALMSGNDVAYSEQSNEALYDAVSIACKAYRIPLAPLKDILHACGRHFTIEDIARISHFSFRQVLLEKNWYASDCGPIIGFLENHETVVCMPKDGAKGGAYTITYVKARTTRILTAAEAETIVPTAFSIYASFPKKSMKWADLMRFGLEGLQSRDIAMVILLALAGTLIGILEPVLNQKVYDEFIPLGDNGLLIQICSFFAAFMISNVFFSIVKNLSTFRLSSRSAVRVQIATYDRLFNLPEAFLQQYSSADLTMRVMGIGKATDAFVAPFFTTFLSTLFSLIYLVRMFKYAKKLAWVAILMISVYVVIVFFLSKRTIRFDKTIQQLSADANSKLGQFIGGIEKLRMAGSETQMLNQYMLPFIAQRKTEITKERLLSLSSMLRGIAPTLFSMVFYYIVVKKKVDVSVGNFIAFNSAFGMLSASLLQASESLVGIFSLRPFYQRFKPIIEAVPEFAEGHGDPGEIDGQIELKHVSFAYAKNAAPVLNDISLSVKPGEYIGIVGPSGCGKSTLLKLLLGFETPSSGSIHYDGKDLASLDKQALRRRLGVVLQNGSLISGSIFENITITAPKATMAQVAAVADAVGLAPDIAEMPMGLYTVLSEDAGSISGGQKQRILIARAVISNPKVLLLDEATSALDNVTQAIVCKNLDDMQVTRIVIAHRLSTIQNCDRILVMEDGRIRETGNFDELMAMRGLFYRLASRQIV